jgi:hypothetical protein
MYLTGLLYFTHHYLQLIVRYVCQIVFKKHFQTINHSFYFVLLIHKQNITIELEKHFIYNEGK